MNPAVPAAAAPNAQQGHSILGMTGQSHGILRISYFLVIDLKDHIAYMQSLVGSGRIWINFRYERAFDVLRNVELRASLRSDVFHTDSLQCVALAAAVFSLRNFLLARQWLEPDIKRL